MKNKVIAINGEAWCHNLTGIERLAIEVTNYLDEKFSQNQAELVVPKNAQNLPNLKNIKIVPLDVEAHFFPKWNQIDFQRYILKNHRIPLDFSNSCPYFSPGFEFIHDIYAHLYKDDLKSSFRDKMIRLYSETMYKRIAKKAKIIFTVSEYTKKTIVDAYNINPEKIKVVYSGVSALNQTIADHSIFQTLPEIAEKKFYFTLGSLSVRKNLQWIAQHAELYPNELFVISGKPLPSVVPPELEKLKTLENVIMTGYLTDEQVKALMESCKAFIFPSYFEGFGLPPLEALSVGAKIIISNTSCLPEIYGDCAYYIDPNEPNVNLDELLKTNVSSPNALLEKFTLKNTAMRMYETITKGESEL